MNRYHELLNILNIGEGISVIAKTGGPCSGKTTGLARLKCMLTDRGHKVLIPPESATKLIMAGMTPGELLGIEFQEEIFLDELSQEDRILSIAMRYRDMGRKVVVLFDRGLMDGEAYVGKEEFKNLIVRLGFTYRQICDERYHAVIHMRTAALGAEKFYSLENNASRIETAEEARALDQRTLEAWQRHQHPRVIDNSTDFEGKLRRLFTEVCEIIGDPVPLEKEEKFLIEVLDPAIIPVKWNESRIIQYYLVTPVLGEEHRVRARSDDGGISYYHTVKTQVSNGVRAEREKMITCSEYEALLTLRDLLYKRIEKRRICFFYGEQFFEVDLFCGDNAGLALMEAERTDRAPTLKIPPFIKVIRDVTDDSKYSNKEIARGSLHS